MNIKTNLEGSTIQESDDLIKEYVRNYVINHADEICKAVFPCISRCITRQHTSIVNGGIYRILNRQSQKAIDVVGGSKSREVNVVIWKKIADNTSQHWKAIQSWSNPEIFSFENMKSEMYLDVKGGIATNNLWQYDSNGSDAQLFKVVDKGDGYFFLYSALRDTHKVSVRNTVHGDGTLIHLANDDLARTMWTFEKVNE